MTRFDVAAELACSPEQAWCLLTDPEQMNVWSTAPIRVADTGRDDRFDRAGAVREVRLPVPLLGRVREVVTQADEPRRLDLMVFAGDRLFRDHNVRIDIEKAAAGCVVRFTVTVSIASKLGVLALSGLRREIRKSLAGLSEHAKLMPPSTPLVARTDASPRVRQSTALLLRPEVDRQLGHQRLIADELAQLDDPKYWIARGNVLVNEELLALIDSRVVENQEWLLRLMTALHRRFVSNLHAFRTGGPMSPAWRRAWERSEESAAGDPGRQVLLGTAVAARAFINEDLPGALADVYTSHYRDTHHYKEFRADFIRLISAYGSGGDRLIAEMPPALTSRVLRLAARTSPTLRHVVVAKMYFDVDAEHLHAFDVGYDLACAHP